MTKKPRAQKLARSGENSGSRVRLRRTPGGRLPRWLSGAFLFFERYPELTNCMQSVLNWSQFMRAYLDLGNSRYPLMLETRSGLRFQLNSLDDVITAWIVVCRGEYVVPSDALVMIDIGANYGAFTLLAAAASPHARVFSLEPYPESFERLRLHVERNGLSDRVSCWPLAVAAQTGMSWMGTETAASSARSLLSKGTQSQNAVEVESISLPDLLARVRRLTDGVPVDLIKMDIEGAEHELVAQITPEALADVREWQMEYHVAGPKEPLFAALERAGMECVCDIQEGTDQGVAWFRKTPVARRSDR